MCLYPRIIKNKRYTVTKKNGGVIPTPPVLFTENGETYYDGRVMYAPTGCGKCIECSKQKARDWQVRLTEDIKDHKNGHMVTLTFSNEAIQELSQGMHRLDGYERDNQIAKKGVKRFLGRWLTISPFLNPEVFSITKLPFTKPLSTKNLLLFN